MTKYFSPSCSYMASLDRLEVEADVLGGVLGVGEDQDAVVEHDHAPVVGRHDLLEVVVAEVAPAERLGDLLVVEVDLADPVHADHRRQLASWSRSPCPPSPPRRRGRPGCSSASRRSCWTTCGRRANSRHARSSLGVSRPRSPSRSVKRSRERSKESSKRTTFSESCDQIGCSWLGRREAHRGPARQPVLHRGAVLLAVLPRRWRACRTGRARRAARGPRRTRRSP